jgi:peptidoglycan/LPS O-acetylase OafA/YrhL
MSALSGSLKPTESPLMPPPQIAEPGLRYRPEIDGLRAIAVLGVLASHFGVPGLQGGFIGVDIFFVISGFLITRMISTEIAQRHFSIWRFYERRARRILPALFFMLFITTVAAVVFLFPTDLLEFSRALLGTVAFISNIEFWRLSQDYFGAQHDMQPLLHTWSLGVEEQFYIFFPLILLAIARLSRALKSSILILLFAASFIISCWNVSAHPISAFYLLPSRFWELLFGAIMSETRFNVPSAGMAALGSVTGFGAIFYGMLLFIPEKTPFPGMAALLPCAGAALLIWASANNNSLAGRLLSARPIVLIGLISYSLYLWHWPLLTYLRYIRADEPSLLDLLAVATLSFVMAIVSWRWIERPFRGYASRISSEALFSGIVAVGLLFAGTWTVIRIYDGLPQRYTKQLRTILDVKSKGYNSNCFDTETDAAEIYTRCRIGTSAAGRPDFLLWGDSHGDAILPAVAAAALSSGRSGIVVLTHDCQPFAAELSSNRACVRSNAVALQILRDQDIKSVILAGNWQELAPKGQEYVTRLGRGVMRLEGFGKIVALVADVPNQPWSVPDQLAKHLLFGWPVKPALSRAEYDEQQKFLLSPANQWTGSQFRILSPAPILCTKKICPVEEGGHPLYKDSAHLSRFGAGLLKPIFQSVL